MKIPNSKGVAFACGAAVLFGAGTPLSKILVGSVQPVMLAGLLYFGSGCGLSVWWLASRWKRKPSESETPLRKHDLPWLCGAILFGGVIGPVLLMLGLSHTPASTASLMLNLEGVLTALLAWFVFRENFDRRIALGMAAITAGGVLLSWDNRSDVGLSWGAIAIAAACLAWAIDNNLTRKVSASDPVQIAGIKGLVAGAVNLGIAFSLGESLPGIETVVLCGGLGLLSYGISLTLFVLALRSLGTARTGAYFSIAPFIGAILAIPLLHETPSAIFYIAAVLMGVGVWLHLTERHEHEHTHDEMTHEHLHVHDEHHQHEHADTDPAGEPHSHVHTHRPLVHSHAHYPDIHHRHSH